MRGKYIISAFLVLIFGSGLAFWQANHEFGLRLQAATHLAAMAQLAAEEQANALREKLDQEMKARETAELAWKKVANRAADLIEQLTQQIGATRRIEASLADAQARMRALDAQLLHETNDKEAALTAKMKAEAEAQAAADKLAIDIKAREAALSRSPEERRALPDHRHKTPGRRQTQTTTLQAAKRQQSSWWSISFR